VSNPGRSVTKSGEGQLLVANVQAGTLEVNSGKLIVVAKGSTNALAGTSVVNALSIIGDGSVDLTNNALIIDYTTLGTQLTTVRSNLASGKLTTSLSAGGFALGYADASVLGRTTFGGVPVDSTAILVGYTHGGDANLDGTVNALDFNAVATNFGVSTSSVWTSGDFNYDGVVNSLDFLTLSQNFGTTVAAPAPVLLGSLVPEPTSIAASALLGLVGRRRRRRA
jgi:hypothetical protein